MPKKEILAIDFDGTVVDNDYPEIGKLLPGAKEALQELALKFKITFWTCRSGKSLNEMKKFLEEGGIPFDTINEEIPGYNDFTDSRKIFAHYYIDDRNFPGGFPGWGAVLQQFRDLE